MRILGGKQGVPVVLGRVRMGSPSWQRFKVPAEQEQGSGKRSGAALWPDGERLKIITRSRELPPARAPSNLSAFKPSPPPVELALINTLLLIGRGILGTGYGGESFWMLLPWNRMWGRAFVPWKSSSVVYLSQPGVCGWLAGLEVWAGWK